MRICDVLQKVLDGTEKRVIIETPPRHGKSELVSRRLPAAFLGRYPDRQVIGCSYNDVLASSMNRDVQRIMSTQEYRALYPGTLIPQRGARTDRLKNKDFFEVIGNSGIYRSAGIGGPITGQGMHLGIVDDPIKNAEEADSEAIRRRHRNWWDSTFMSREEGDASIVVMATRWHEEDLIGWILAEAEKTGERWLVLKLEALREDMSDPLDPRKEGEALWEAKFSTAKMQATKKRLSTGPGLRWWNSIYQQKPSALEGNLFKRGYWEEFDIADAPNYVGFVNSYDTASDTKTQNDWSVGGKFGIWWDSKRGEWRADLVDVWREKVEFPALKTHVKDAAARDKPAWILIERKSSGIQLIQEIRHKTTLPIWGERQKDGKMKWGFDPGTQDKVARAMPTLGKISGGVIRIVKDAPWKADFYTETATFPNATHDDQVDMLTQFINWFRIHWKMPAEKVLKNNRSNRRSYFED